MEDSGITNLYIDKLMNNISKSFQGTYSSNNIPTFNNHNFSLIINTSKQSETGTHFIALCIFEDKILYFDSFGLKNYNSDIVQYLKKYNQKIIYSTKCIQDPISDHCGFFCISFILSIEKNMSLVSFLKLFSTKVLLINDYICIEIIKYHIKFPCI